MISVSVAVESGVEDLELFSGWALWPRYRSLGENVTCRTVKDASTTWPQIDVMACDSPIFFNGELTLECPRLHLKRYVFPLLRA